jgi:hypothetical protein
MTDMCAHCKKNPSADGRFLCVACIAATPEAAPLQQPRLRLRSRQERRERRSAKRHVPFKSSVALAKNHILAKLGDGKYYLRSELTIDVSHFAQKVAFRELVREKKIDAAYVLREGADIAPHLLGRAEVFVPKVEFVSSVPESGSRQALEKMLTKRRGRYDALVVELHKRPGEWAKVAECPSRKEAIKMYQGLARRPDIEARSRDRFVFARSTRVSVGNG